MILATALILAQSIPPPPAEARVRGGRVAVRLEADAAAPALEARCATVTVLEARGEFRRIAPPPGFPEGHAIVRRARVSWGGRLGDPRSKFSSVGRAEPAGWAFRRADGPPEPPPSEAPLWVAAAALE
jgi:hypothetical protein